MKRFFARSALVVSLLPSLPAYAANFDDPTWPCIQRKVPNLSIGQMWTGEIVENFNESVRDDSHIAVLASAIAVRRTSLEEAETLVSSFAKTLDEGRERKLAELFALVFERIDSERSQIIGGIARYAGKQTGLAERIDKKQEELAALEAKDEKSNDEFDRLEELTDTLDWDVRIFEERQQSLTYVCETPVLLEKRAFALAKIIMAQMEE